MRLGLAVHVVHGFRVLHARHFTAAVRAPRRRPAPERTRSAVLARSRSGERRRIAADAYRQAQQEGSDPVLAVMLATGRNRRRSLRLIAGARDEGLLTPRHNKR
ncbi:hypothetical protein BX264_6362 [Streptomyces sp. 2333.5]|uniref:DUF6214 family protein n=1 Tax=Streptomyces sp. 2333.5 TaxID=1938842 RepID=UPI000C24318D|nr:hypothetical protein BX264_6362 [Streptomyces sp. 2333.5]